MLLKRITDPSVKDISALHPLFFRLMDLFYVAVNLFRKRDFIKCVHICTEILQSDSQHQAAWVLKMRALTQRVAYDDTDVLESLAEASSADNQWTKTAPPGTSTIGGPRTGQRNSTGAHRPSTQSRPVSGVVRLNRSGLNGSHDGSGQHTAKTRAQTGRLLSRLGTASLSTETESFINLARLNLAQHATLPQLTKPLFEYIYFVEGNIKSVSNILRLFQTCFV